jgi:hypothetical protein
MATLTANVTNSYFGRASPDKFSMTNNFPFVLHLMNDHRPIAHNMDAAISLFAVLWHKRKVWLAVLLAAASAVVVTGWWWRSSERVETLKRENPSWHDESKRL